ncbi:MAG: ABC transporter ATP-binding protein [Cyclobacteriaceae bacterium]
MAETGTKKVLHIEGLTKRFGKLTAVNQLDLKIYQGQIFGILGPNGSGKTTTLGMILDVVAPSEGSYRWFSGQNNVDSRKRIGSILETPCFYPYLNAEQNLRIVSHIKKCDESRIPKVLKTVNLFDRKGDKFKVFSLGMKQRLSIAAALLADPPVLILDEPTNGLDPQGIAEVRRLIKDIASNGKTILIASHLLDEVQKVCSDFIILRNGIKLHEGKVNDILGDKDEILISANHLSQLHNVIKKYPGAKSVIQKGTDLLVEINEQGSAEDINQFCFEQGSTLTKVLTMTRSLEEEFLKILNEN